MSRTLILGGARSGKSRFAEQLVPEAGAVTYVAPGYPPGDDAEWAARVAAHQVRRPATWRTVETTDVATVLSDAVPDDVILIDCLGTWLTRILDDIGAWTDTEGWQGRLAETTGALVRAWQRCRAGTVVAVSPEVGLGIVPGTPAGRLFRDAQGTLNQRVAAHSTALYLVVAGRPLLFPPIKE